MRLENNDNERGVTSVLSEVNGNNNQSNAHHQQYYHSDESSHQQLGILHEGIEEESQHHLPSATITSVEAVEYS